MTRIPKTVERPLLLFSACHLHANTPQNPRGRGVSTPGGIDERTACLGTLPGMMDECKRQNVELKPITGDALGNWGTAICQFEQARRDDRVCVLVEMHLNYAKPSQTGSLVEFNETELLAKSVLVAVAELVPPHKSHPVVRQPKNPQYPNDAMFDTLKGGLYPAILVESGHVTDPSFCAWIDISQNQAELGRVVAKQLCEWLYDCQQRKAVS